MSSAKYAGVLTKQEQTHCSTPASVMEVSDSSTMSASNSG